MEILVSIKEFSKLQGMTVYWQTASCEDILYADQGLWNWVDLTWTVVHSPVQGIKICFSHVHERPNVARMNFGLGSEFKRESMFNLIISGNCNNRIGTTIEYPSPKFFAAHQGFLVAVESSHCSSADSNSLLLWPRIQFKMDSSSAASTSI